MNNIVYKHMDKERLHWLLLNAIVILEHEFGYDFEQLEENLGIELGEYNKLQRIDAPWTSAKELKEWLNK